MLPDSCILGEQSVWMSNPYMSVFPSAVSGQLWAFAARPLHLVPALLSGSQRGNSPLGAMPMAHVAEYSLGLAFSGPLPVDFWLSPSAFYGASTLWSLCMCVWMKRDAPCWAKFSATDRLLDCSNIVRCYTPWLEQHSSVLQSLAGATQFSATDRLLNWSNNTACCTSAGWSHPE